MPRYFARISYVGTAYNGWQIQKNTPRTIQQIMNERISGLLNEKIEFTGCGRTDTGVHAKEYYAHFDSVNDLLAPEFYRQHHESADSDDWAYKFNSVLPYDIVVSDIFKVKDDAHARFDARSRTYRYHITRERDPFLVDRAYFLYAELDTDAMDLGCKTLLEYSDFSCFSKSHTQVRSNLCKIMEASCVWDITEGSKIIFTIKADRFLRNMVRAIVGTMLEIGKGKLTLNDLPKIIEGKNRSEAGISVPAHGLYLEEVNYDEELIMVKVIEGK